MVNDQRRTNRVCLAAAVALLCSCLARAEWKPADGPLMTRWAKEVSPQNAHPEYPRPQMVREDWLNLNGLWDYAIKPKDAAKPADKEKPADKDQPAAFDNPKHQHQHPPPPGPRAPRCDSKLSFDYRQKLHRQDHLILLRSGRQAYAWRLCCDSGV